MWSQGKCTNSIWTVPTVIIEPGSLPLQGSNSIVCHCTTQLFKLCWIWKCYCTKRWECSCILVIKNADAASSYSLRQEDLRSFLRKDLRSKDILLQLYQAWVRPHQGIVSNFWSPFWSPYLRKDILAINECSVGSPD